MWDEIKMNSEIEGLVFETQNIRNVVIYQVLDEGPLVSDELSGVKIKLVDVELHEDPVHRGPAQIVPAIKNAFNDAFKLADPYLMEPILKVPSLY